MRALLLPFVLFALTACGQFDRVSYVESELPSENLIEGNHDEASPRAYKPSEKADFELVQNRLFPGAEAYVREHSSQFRNQNFIAVVDFSLHSGKPRMFIKDLRSGAIESLFVAHGNGSDANNDGFAERFSNVSGSNASSIGYFRTAETYIGHNGLSLRIDGLSQTNSNVRSRAVVIHGSNYVSTLRAKQGMSAGCFAIPIADRDRVVRELKGGALLFAFQ